MAEKVLVEIKTEMRDVRKESQLLLSSMRGIVTEMKGLYQVNKDGKLSVKREDIASFRKLQEALDTTFSMLSEIAPTTTNVLEIINRLSNTVGILGEASGDAVTSFYSLIGAQQLLSGQGTQLLAVLKSIVDVEDEYNKQLKEQEKAAKAAAKEQEKLAKQNTLSAKLKSWSKGWTDLVSASNVYIKVAKKIVQAFVDITKAGIELQDELVKMQVLFDDPTIVDALHEMSYATDASTDEMTQFLQLMNTKGLNKSDALMMLQTTIDLANTNGTSFSTMASAVEGALSGQTRSIKKYLPDVTKEMLTNLDSTKSTGETVIETWAEVGKSVRESSQEIVDSKVSSQIKELKEDWLYLKQNAGLSLTLALQDSGILQALDKFVDWISNPFNTANAFRSFSPEFNAFAISNQGLAAQAAAYTAEVNKAAKGKKNKVDELTIPITAFVNSIKPLLAGNQEQIHSAYNAILSLQSSNDENIVTYGKAIMDHFLKVFPDAMNEVLEKSNIVDFETDEEVAEAPKIFSGSLMQLQTELDETRSQYEALTAQYKEGLVDQKLYDNAVQEAEAKIADLTKQIDNFDLIQDAQATMDLYANAETFSDEVSTLFLDLYDQLSAAGLTDLANEVLNKVTEVTDTALKKEQEAHEAELAERLRIAKEQAEHWDNFGKSIEKKDAAQAAQNRAANMFLESNIEDLVEAMKAATSLEELDALKEVAESNRLMGVYNENLEEQTDRILKEVKESIIDELKDAISAYKGAEGLSSNAFFQFLDLYDKALANNLPDLANTILTDILSKPTLEEADAVKFKEAIKDFSLLDLQLLDKAILSTDERLQVFNDLYADLYKQAEKDRQEAHEAQKKEEAERKKNAKEAAKKGMLGYLEGPMSFSGFRQNMEAAENNGYTDVSEAYQSYIDSLTGFEKLGEMDILETFMGGLGDATKWVINLVKAFEAGTGWLTIIVEVVKGFVNEIGPVLEAVFQPFIDFLQSIGASIADWIIPLLDVFIPMLQSILVILEPILQMLGSIISPIIEWISMALEILWPVIEKCVKAVQSVVAVFKWVVDQFKYFVDKIKYNFENAHIDVPDDFLGAIFGYNKHTHPWYIFGGPAKGDAPTAPQALGDRLKEIWSANLFPDLTENVHDEEEAKKQASASSIYSGGGELHLTINFNSPVVGEDGMEEFCIMIKDTFNEMGYYQRG